MRKNMGGLDKGIRVAIAIILMILYFTDTVTGTMGAVSLIVAAVFLLTSLVSFCPLYTLLGMKTCSVS
jgi:hypothetical protein